MTTIGVSPAQAGPVMPLATACELLEAIDLGQLRLEYQPIYELRELRPVGVEALVRWQHPERGRLRPAAFLPEDLTGGIAGALTLFVLDEAIRQAATWRRAGLDIGMSVNVAPTRLADDSVVEQICDVLERDQFPAHRLTVELTEQPGFSGPMLRPALTELSRLGVRLSLDDFGLGDASLGRLQQLHFDEIKIDRSFVRDVAIEPTDRKIVAFTSDLAHSLGMQVVAEGVESDACLGVLGDLGVDHAQGYALGRPSPPELLFAPA